MKPSERIPELTDSRLTIVADILRRSRDSAARNAKRHLGDTLCSVGLVAYERSVRALAEAAKDLYRDWLSVGYADDHFLIKILGKPVRFYPGDPDLPIPARTLKIGEKERLQTELALGEGLTDIKCLRFEIEKNPKGFTQAVNFVFVRKDGTRLDSWPIPRHVEVPLADGFVRKGAVRLKPISLDDAPNAVDGRSGA